MKIGIIGKGHVGKAMSKIFPDAYIYDKFLKIGDYDKLNEMDVLFVCVPTPEGKDGKADTSIVEGLINDLNPKLFILRSTVYIGFTDEMAKKYNKSIVFQPEYYGETVAHPFADLGAREWISFGGVQSSIDLAIEAYQQVINSNVRIYQAPAREVEFAKYMENAYLATKVTFVNEMFDISQKMDINYNVAREIWVADPRIGMSHTFVYKDNRGYGGKCLPKDINNLISQGNESGADVSLLEAIDRKNKSYK